MDYEDFGSFIVREDDDTGERLFSGGYVGDKDGGPMDVGEVLELDPACLPVGAIVKITSPVSQPHLGQVILPSGNLAESIDSKQTFGSEK